MSTNRVLSKRLKIAKLTGCALCLLLGRTGKDIRPILFRYLLRVAISCVTNVVLLVVYMVDAKSLLHQRVVYVRTTRFLPLIHVSARLVSPDQMAGIVLRVKRENTPMWDRNSALVTLGFMVWMAAIAPHASPENSLSVHKQYAHYVKSESIPPLEQRHALIVPGIHTRLFLVQQSKSVNATPVSQARAVHACHAQPGSTRIL